MSLPKKVEVYIMIIFVIILVLFLLMISRFLFVMAMSGGGISILWFGIITFAVGAVIGFVMPHIIRFIQSRKEKKKDTDDKD